MSLKLILVAAHILEGMFFIGIIGCAVAIAVSWVSIFKDGFSDKPN
jgi:hypothetical protein